MRWLFELPWVLILLLHPLNRVLLECRPRQNHCRRQNSSCLFDAHAHHQCHCCLSVYFCHCPTTFLPLTQNPNRSRVWHEEDCWICLRWQKVPRPCPCPCCDYDVPWTHAPTTLRPKQHFCLRPLLCHPNLFPKLFFWSYFLRRRCPVFFFFDHPVLLWCWWRRRTRRRGASRMSEFGNVSRFEPQVSSGNRTQVRKSAK